LPHVRQRLPDLLRQFSTAILILFKVSENSRLNWLWWPPLHAVSVSDGDVPRV
jgi:hypothetical protein